MRPGHGPPCRVWNPTTNWCSGRSSWPRRRKRRLGGALGRPSGARFRTYERLMKYGLEVYGTLFDTIELRKTIDEIYRFPLQQMAIDQLNRQMKSSSDIQQLVRACRGAARRGPSLPGSGRSCRSGT